MSGTPPPDVDSSSTIVQADCTDAPTSVEDFRIGWIAPSHLFVSASGESLCGQSGDRESMSKEEIHKYTFPLTLPVGRLRNKEQVMKFANSICNNCLRTFYNRLHPESNSVLEVYSKEIKKYDKNGKIGLCHSCYDTVDARSCHQAMFNSRQTIYICDLCCMGNFEELLASLGTGTDPSLRKLQGRLKEKLERKRDSV